MIAAACAEAPGNMNPRILATILAALPVGWDRIWRPRHPGLTPSLLLHQHHTRLRRVVSEAGRSTATFVAGWAGPARARSALVPPSCLKDLPSYARNATAPIDPIGCSARGPNANRGRIADMRPAGMGSRVVAQRIDREVLVRQERTRRQINQGSTRRPLHQLQ